MRIKKKGGGGGNSSITLNVGESCDLAAALVFTPPDAANKNVIWYIDEGVTIVTLDTETGVITAADKAAYYAATGEGVRSAEVTVTTVDGNKQAACAVNVVFTPVPVTSVTITQGASLDLDAEDTAALTATVFPINANNYTFSWASSDPAVVTVAPATGALTAGNVTANASAIVTVTAVDAGNPAHNKSASITVNVKKVDIFWPTSTAHSGWPRRLKSLPPTRKTRTTNIP
ncbi:MAG: Ig-like domain-containing protein [Spirochaetaceae bacterium]|nr:Ig-like domain-containing protein [Spirochaetaceae bacterium]